MNNYYKHMTTLSWIIEDVLKVSGEWNGDEPGREEDRAHFATEIAEKVTELKKMLEELEES